MAAVTKFVAKSE